MGDAGQKIGVPTLAILWPKKEKLNSKCSMTFGTLKVGNTFHTTIQSNIRFLKSGTSDLNSESLFPNSSQAQVGQWIPPLNLVVVKCCTFNHIGH